MDTPAALLERLRQSEDNVAWREFVYLYTPLFYSWALRLGLQAADAVDLVQEVFLALFKSLPEFHYERPHSFQAWLYSLMRNRWQDWRRRRIPMPAGGIEAALDERGHGDDAAPLEEAEYRVHLCARALRLIQSEFTPVTWMTFWATVVEGRPPREVALELGITPNAVYLARGRVLRRLRETLNGLLD